MAMMRRMSRIGVVAVLGATGVGEASAQITIQQHCSAEADARGLSGQARHDYRRQCLQQYEPAPAPAPPTRQQACSAEADALRLTGQARWEFRAGCLRRP